MCRATIFHYNFFHSYSRIAISFLFFSPHHFYSLFFHLTSIILQIFFLCPILCSIWWVLEVFFYYNLLQLLLLLPLLWFVRCFPSISVGERFFLLLFYNLFDERKNRWRKLWKWKMFAVLKGLKEFLHNTYIVYWL